MLYLRGLSTGDFREALAALLGDDAAGLSATNEGDSPYGSGIFIDRRGRIIVSTTRRARSARAVVDSSEVRDVGIQQGGGPPGSVRG